MIMQFLPNGSPKTCFSKPKVVQKFGRGLCSGVQNEEGWSKIVNFSAAFAVSCSSLLRQLVATRCQLDSLV